MFAAVDLHQLTQALPSASSDGSSCAACVTATHPPIPTTCAKSRVRSRHHDAPAEPPLRALARSHSSSAGRVPEPDHERLDLAYCLPAGPGSCGSELHRAIAISGHQPLCLPQAHTQYGRRRLRHAPASQYLSQDLTRRKSCLLISANPSAASESTTQDGAATRWLCRATTLSLALTGSLYRIIIIRQCTYAFIESIATIPTEQMTAATLRTERQPQTVASLSKKSFATARTVPIDHLSLSRKAEHRHRSKPKG